MKAHGFWTFPALVLLLALLAAPSWGGQVVTDEARSWAKQALGEEKSLQPPQQKNTVAVLYFQNKTGAKELDPFQKGLAVMLVTDLTAVKSLQVVERVRLQALTEEMGLGASGLVDPDSSPRVGKLLGAYWLTGGEIGGDKAAVLSIDASVLDVPAPRVAGQPSAKGSLSEFFRVEKDLLFEIIALLKIELTPEEKARLKKPCSTNTDALIALFKGIDMSDRKDYEKAAQFYEKAIKEDPDICIAREALGELEALGLVGGPEGAAEAEDARRSSNLLRSLRDRTSLTDQYPREDPLRRTPTPKDVGTPVDIDVIFPNQR